MKILITGATGFIGRALVSSLCQQKIYSPIAAARQATSLAIPTVAIGELSPHTNWLSALVNVEVVIHLAGRAHILKEHLVDSYSAFHTSNTAATINLAQQAANAKIKRFIFISSIGVNGNETFAKPFSEIDDPRPKGDFALSKYHAEISLRQIAAQTDMEVVIIRPPLVYGANAPGNFGKLIKTLANQTILPLGNIKNQRSFVALSNLINFITTCISHPAAANQIFLVSDGEDLSTTELLERLSIALGRSARLLPIPQKFLAGSLKLLGKEVVAQRLCGNLQIDMSRARELLGWSPPISVSEALKQTAQDYLQQHSSSLE